MASRKVFLVLLAGVCAVLVACGTLWHIQEPSWSNTGQIQLMRKSLRSELSLLLRAEPTPWNEHVIPILKEALDFLEDRNTLEKPYILFSYLGGSEIANMGGRVSLLVIWLEIEFKSGGIRISFAQDGIEKTVDIPFADDMWNEQAINRYSKLPCRDVEFSGIVREDNIIFQVKRSNRTGGSGLDSTAKLPLSIVLEPPFVRIYDAEGSASQPCQLFVDEKVRKFVEEKQDAEPNLPMTPSAEG